MNDFNARLISAIGLVDQASAMMADPETSEDERLAMRGSLRRLYVTLVELVEANPERQSPDSDDPKVDT